MASLTMQSSLVRTPLATTRRAANQSVRACTPVRANMNAEEPTSRRGALALIATVLVGTAAQRATAITIPYQESMGGVGVGGGSLPLNMSEASSSAYNMEGIKKRGISAKKKKELLAAVRKAAGPDKSS